MNFRAGITTLMMGALIANIAMADPMKKGRVMCEGGACSSQEVPTGGLYEGAREFVADFGERVQKRIEIAERPPQKQPNRRIEKKSSLRREPTLSNLPQYYQGVNHHGFEASEKVVYVPKSSDPRLKGLKAGDVVWAVVEQQIVASPSVATPVRAIALRGPFKGGFFLGEATLDRELKRILFSFTKLRLKDRDTTYSLKAAGLSPLGSIGLEGEYVSQTGKFFVAELASAAAAGFVDSTVNRNQNVQGNYVQEPSLANSGKSAAVTALSKTTERMAESARSAPEYTRIQGYQEIQIIIQDDPAESGN